jgi:4-carboxymuconolactone decarboxylase
MEEVVLQSYLFAGFPRALNAAREWRRVTGSGAPLAAAQADGAPEPAATLAGVTYAAAFEWRLRGEETCAAVYGPSYEKLRANITALHPALDQWMIVEGYGKVLSRSGLDIGRRELCIVAACAAAQQDRQLHSHLLGARNVGVPDDVVGATIEALAGAIPDGALATARLLWQRVRGK